MGEAALWEATVVGGLGPGQVDVCPIQGQHHRATQGPPPQASEGTCRREAWCWAPGRALTWWEKQTADAPRSSFPTPRGSSMPAQCPAQTRPGAPLSLAPASPSPGTSGPCSPLQRAFISLAFPGLGGQGQASSLLLTVPPLKLTTPLSPCPPPWAAAPWVPAPRLSHSNPVHPHCAGLVFFDHLPSIFKFKHS